MTIQNEQTIIDSNLEKDYEYGFVTDIESETIPPGLNEDVIRTISKKKEEPQWLLDWRLKSYRHWLDKQEPNWANIGYPDICLLYTSPSPRDLSTSRMPSSA